VRRAYLIVSQTAELGNHGKTDVENAARLDYYKSMSTVREINEAIEHLDVREQIRLLQGLPAHLKIQADDVAWLKAAEPTFEFWNNPEDAIYDEL